MNTTARHLDIAGPVEQDRQFEALVAALTPQRDMSVAGAGFVVQARRVRAERQTFLDTHGALTGSQVAELAGSRAVNRWQTAYRWTQQRRIFAVRHDGRRLYPRFQFDGATGQPKPQIFDVLGLLPPTLTGWSLAMWWDTPAPDVAGWVTPIEMLDDTPTLRRLAQSEWDGWQADNPHS